jgi:tryptophan-rich sensory protein
MEAAEKHRGAGAALVVCLALPLGAAALGGAATASSVDTWYPELAKPAWTPPGWIFGPVWTVLYLMMGTASWLVWRERPRARALVDRALALYAAQLALNVLWSVVFFGLRRPGWAVAEIALLWLAILATLAGRTAGRRSGGSSARRRGRTASRRSATTAEARCRARSRACRSR